MAIQTFTIGQTLTASQMSSLQSNDFNQTVSTKTASYTLVAADKGTRIVMNVASANTVTVNTSLFTAGDTLVIQNIGAGVSTVTAGTATVSSAGPLAIPQNGSGILYFTSAGVAIFYPSAVTVAAPSPSGMTLIQADTSTTAATVTYSSVFSATYSLYKIFITVTSASTGYAGLRFTTGGTPNTSSDYVFGYDGTDGTGQYVETTEATPRNYAAWQQNFNGNGFTELTISNPYQSAVSRGVFMSKGYYGGGTNYYVSGGFLFDNTTSFDGFQLFNQSANTWTYTTSVYGLAIS